MPHCLVLVCHQHPPTNHLSQSNQTSLAAPCQHTQCCQRCWMVVFVVCHGCMLVLQHTWCHGQSPPPLCGCHSLSPCHPIHVIHTKPCQQVCNVWVWCQLSTHLTNLFVACIAWWLCVVVCSFTLVLMPHHQLCTPWAAMPWCVATSVFVLCVCLAFHCVHHHHNLVAPLVCVCVVGQHQVSVVVGLFVDWSA